MTAWSLSLTLAAIFSQAVPPRHAEAELGMDCDGDLPQSCWLAHPSQCHGSAASQCDLLMSERILPHNILVGEDTSRQVQGHCGVHWSHCWQRFWGPGKLWWLGGHGAVACPFCSFWRGGKQKKDTPYRLGFWPFVYWQCQANYSKKSSSAIS